MATTTAPRLKDKYRAEIVKALRDEFKHGNVNEVASLTKVVVNMGVGEAAKDSKLMDGAIADLAAITGQKPQVTKATEIYERVPDRGASPRRSPGTISASPFWPRAEGEQHGVLVPGLEGTGHHRDNPDRIELPDLLEADRRA